MGMSCNECAGGTDVAPRIIRGDWYVVWRENRTDSLMSAFISLVRDQMRHRTRCVSACVCLREKGSTHGTRDDPFSPSDRPLVPNPSLILCPF